MFPIDDTFKDHVLDSVTEHDTSWSIGYGGWGFGFDKVDGIIPKVGSIARFYPGEIGRHIRGLFIDGQKVYYRTEAEDKEYQEIQLYGADCADWLARWDRGNHVWSVEMGGLGPGYEQCIQITTAEILRHFLAEKYDASLWNDKDIWKQVRDATDKAVMAVPFIKKLGLSGAQWGGAMNLATNLYKRGPRACLTDKEIENRKIQVGRNFPQAA